MSNIDLEEIAKFDTLAHEWLNPHGKMRALHALNPLRINFINTHASLHNVDILDVGCGGGILTLALAQGVINNNCTITGLDKSSKLLAVATQHANAHNLSIDYINATVEEFSLTANKQFDIITCMELVEHVPDPKSIIHACCKLLKPTGILFISTINRTLKAFCKSIILGEFILKLLPKHTHQYHKFLKPAEINDLLPENFKIKALAGVNYLPFLELSWYTKKLDVNYLLAVSKN